MRETKLGASRFNEAGIEPLYIIEWILGSAAKVGKPRQLGKPDKDGEGGAGKQES